MRIPVIRADRLVVSDKPKRILLTPPKPYSPTAAAPGSETQPMPPADPVHDMNCDGEIAPTDKAIFDSLTFNKMGEGPRTSGLECADASDPAAGCRAPERP